MENFLGNFRDIVWDVTLRKEQLFLEWNNIFLILPRANFKAPIQSSETKMKCWDFGQTKTT